MLQVLETQRLGPRSLVSVIEFRDTQYLLVQGEHGVSCVASVPAGDQP
jgi:flagellar biogenesis protein FliO